MFALVGSDLGTSGKRAWSQISRIHPELWACLSNHDLPWDNVHVPNQLFIWRWVRAAHLLRERSWLSYWAVCCVNNAPDMCCSVAQTSHSQSLSDRCILKCKPIWQLTNNSRVFALSAWYWLKIFSHDEIQFTVFNKNKQQPPNCDPQ